MRAEGLFRQEALDEHTRAFDREGKVLRIAPAWTSTAYWLVTAVAGAGLAFIALASVPRYAEGPAIVRVEPLEEVEITRKGARLEVLAFLPGHHLPSLLPGMTLRLELEGWPQTYQEVTVETVGKSVLGLLVGILAGREVLDTGELVTERVPEVGDSGYAGATVQHLLDMTAAIDFVEDYAVDFWRYDVACGWHPPVEGADALNRQ